MNVNIQKTTEYYKTAKHCDCDVCRYFCSHIRALRPDIAAYLDTLGVDIEKPFELVWLENLVGKEEQVAQEFQLHYDQEKGEFSGGTETKVKERILHRDGIEEAYVSEEDQLVSHSIYLPKQMNREAAQ